jgi:hypothetical protein
MPPWRVADVPLAPATEGSRITFMVYSAPDTEYRYTELVGMMPRGFADNTFFGQFQNNSNIYAAVRYSF